MSAVSSVSMDRSHWSKFVGKWQMSSPIFEGKSGSVEFEWMEGGRYIALRFQPPEPAPASVWLIGADESTTDYTALYADSRGVSRVYRMKLEPHLWMIERHGEPFSQRFEGRLSSDGNRIDGAWYSAQGGGEWKKDFDLTYVRQPA
ncbi:MAG: hypothetical protein J0I21_19575 [Alphaproteobacteria bacterium]|nr:hypothetical protein [Alphaproteobacteria bacterium]